ncbi:MAG: hypothetical protein P8M25_11200 [Paracoccaceae bacterium]|nr:hypothetical protein [Paracoccaceae bacterium]
MLGAENAVVSDPWLTRIYRLGSMRQSRFRVLKRSKMGLSPARNCVWDRFCGVDKSLRYSFLIAVWVPTCEHLNGCLRKQKQQNFYRLALVKSCASRTGFVASIRVWDINAAI